MSGGPRQPGPPPRRLRRAVWREAKLVALDFEATGLDLARDSLISFGAVPVDRGRVDVGSAVYRLIEPDVAPSPESVTIHGLRAQDLRGAPTLDEVRGTLRAALEGRFLLTWWADIEAAFLDKVYGGGRGHWLRRSIDVRELAIVEERFEGSAMGARDYTLSATARRFGVPVAHPHHALDDALVTAQLFLVCATRLQAHGYRTVRSLLRMQSPDLPPWPMVRR